MADDTGAKEGEVHLDFGENEKVNEESNGMSRASSSVGIVGAENLCLDVSEEEVDGPSTGSTINEVAESPHVHFNLSAAVHQREGELGAFGPLLKRKTGRIVVKRCEVIDGRVGIDTFEVKNVGGGLAPSRRREFMKVMKSSELISKKESKKTSSSSQKEGAKLTKWLLESALMLKLGSHPNIVALLDTYLLSKNELCLFCEVPGESPVPLSQAYTADGGLPSTVTAVTVGLKLARGIAHAHSRGVTLWEVTSESVYIDMSKLPLALQLWPDNGDNERGLRGFFGWRGAAHNALDQLIVKIADFSHASDAGHFGGCRASHASPETITLITTLPKKASPPKSPLKSQFDLMAQSPKSEVREYIRTAATSSTPRSSENWESDRVHLAAGSQDEWAWSVVLEETLPRLPAQGKAPIELRKKCNLLMLECRNTKPGERPGINTICTKVLDALASVSLQLKQEGGIAEEPPVSAEILAGLHSRLAELFERKAEATANNLDRAEYHYDQCLKLTRRRFGTQHAAYALALDNKAGFLVSVRRRADEALPLFEEALNIRQENLGENMHPAVASSLVNVAEIYLEKGRVDEAHSAYSHALSIRERALGKGNPGVGAALCGLAAVSKEKGLIDEAEIFYRRALTVAVDSCGPEDMALVPVLEGLADCRLDSHDYEAGKKLYSRVAKISNAHGDIPVYAAALNRLAVVAHLQGRKSEAENLYKRALTLRIRTLGTTHIDTAQSLFNLAIFLNDRVSDKKKSGTTLSPGPIDVATKNEAKRLLMHALHIIENQLGSEHPMTMRINDAINRIDPLFSPTNKNNSPSSPEQFDLSSPNTRFKSPKNGDPSPTEVPTLLF